MNENTTVLKGIKKHNHGSSSLRRDNGLCSSRICHSLAMLMYRLIVVMQKLEQSTILSHSMLKTKLNG